MKAWILKDIGQFEYCETITQPLDPDEVRIKVKACGICGSDIPRVYENGAHKMPLIIGHEFAGEIIETGSNVPSDVLGVRAGIFPLIPCGKCTMCANKKYEMCTSYNYLGSRTDGGFAEEVNVPYRNIIALPDNVTYEQAAMLEPMAVAVHAMRQVEINADDRVVVCGMGTIGTLLAMFLRERGIKNIITLGSKDSLDILKDGVDVFFECVGKNETINEAIDYVNGGGCIVMVGNPHSDITMEQNTYWKILRRQLTIKGTWNSSFLGTNDKDSANDDWHYVIDRLSKGDLHPEEIITHRFPLDKIDKGFEIMKNRSEKFKKIMMINY